MNKLNKQTVENVNIATDTIEHRVRAVKAPLAEHLHGCFAVVQRPIDSASGERDVDGENAIVELLTVSADQTLLHVRRDLMSESGWRAEPIKMPTKRADGQKVDGNIVQIAAFYQGTRIYAMVHYQSAKSDTRLVIAMVYRENEGWRELRLNNDVANALYSTRQTDVYRTPNGYHFFYGVSTAYQNPQLFLVFETGQDGVWAAVNETIDNPDSTYRLLPGSEEAGDGHTLMEISGANAISRAFYLDYEDDDYFIEWGAENGRLSLPASADASNIFAFPSRVNTPSVLLHTPSKQLQYIAGYERGELRQVSLTGGQNQPHALESISIGRDRFDRAIVFATSAKDRRLWVLRQTGLDRNKDLTFADWVCLGNQAAVIGCPRAMLDGAELFLVNAQDRRLMHMRQNSDTTIWHSNAINVAIDDDISAQAINVHAVDIHALDSSNTFVSGAALELQTSHAADITINGVVRQAHSQKWLRINADIAGKISVTIPADSLTAPQITIRISETGKQFTVDPANKVSTRLRGKDPRMPLDVPSLRKAGLIPEQLKGEEANNVVSLIKQFGKACDSNDAPQSNKAKRVTVKSNDTTKTKHVQSYDVDLAELTAAGNYVGSLPQAAPTIGAQIGQFLGDVLNWVEQAVEDVSQFVVTAANGVVRLVLTIGETIHDFVVDAAESIARAFEAVFTSIANMFNDIVGTVVDVVESIVRFVSALFGWEDILLTNDFLQLSINDTLDSIEQTFSVDAVNWLQEKVSGMKTSLDDAFDELEKSLGIMDPLQANDNVMQDEQGQKMNAARDDNRVSTDLVFNQMQRHPDQVSPKVSESTEDDPMSEFMNKIHASYEENLVVKMGEIGEGFKPTSIEELFSQGMTTAVKAIRPLLYFAIDLGGELLIMGVKLIARVLRELKKLLNTEINIPIVSDFYSEHSGGQKLMVMDIMTLLIAAPMTILYKLVLGGKELKAPVTVENLQELKSAPFKWGELMHASRVIASPDSPNAKKQAPALLGASPAQFGAQGIEFNSQAQTLWDQAQVFRLKAGNAGSALAQSQANEGFHATYLLMLVELKKISDSVELIALTAWHEIEKTWNNIRAWGHQALIDAGDFLQKHLPLLTIIGGVISIIYGVICSIKHAVDVGDITGTGATIMKGVAYIIQFFNFVIGLPSIAITVAQGITQTAPEDSDYEKVTPPFLLSYVTGLFALVGLGFVIVGMVAKLDLNPIFALVLMIVDFVFALVIAGFGVYTVYAVVTRGNKSQDPTVIGTEIAEQTATFLSSVPGFLSWITLAIVIMRATPLGPTAGAIMLTVLIATEVICNTGAGISMIVQGGLMASQEG